jgi:glycosyltransferase involved in cell wall biosynthesis
MKIAFLNFYSGLSNRGAETVVLELASRLAGNNEVVVFQGGPRNGSRKYHVVTLASSGMFTFTIKTLLTIIKSRPDIVIPINGRVQALIMSLYCRLSGAKLVITGHSGPGFDDRWNLLMKPHLFIALTGHQLEWAKQATIWKQEFTLIPNGVDLDRFTSGGTRAKLDLEKPIIIMVAATTLAKRVEQGIRAIASLKSGSLILLGSGPLDKRIDNLGYKLLGKKRFFHTVVDHDLTPEFYHAADLFTLCSDSSEAFGVVYLEAMASGLACVATDDESRQEIIGNAGVFVKDPNDTAEYSKALETALKTNWHDLPRKQAEKFSWEVLAKKYEKNFEKLINKK